MPAAVNNGFEPERFASLWAGCDTGNANEAESVNKFRALKEAFGQITQLADALAREREITTDLREELSAAAVAESRARPLPARASHGEVVNGGLVAAVSIVTVVLMIAAVFQSFQ